MEKVVYFAGAIRGDRSLANVIGGNRQTVAPSFWKRGLSGGPPA